MNTACITSGYNSFQRNSLYGKILTKKEPIRFLRITSLAYNNIVNIILYFLLIFLLSILSLLFAALTSFGK